MKIAEPVKGMEKGEAQVRKGRFAPLVSGFFQERDGVLVDTRLGEVASYLRDIIPDYFDNFRRWNRVVSYGLNRFSRPYREQQDVVIECAGTLEWGSLLDDGCGEGRVIEEVLRSGKDYSSAFALDPDADVLMKVRKRIPDKRVVLLNTSSFLPLPFFECSLDLIISTLGGVTYGSVYFSPEGMVFHKKDALVYVLAERHRVLKKGGHLILGSLKPYPDFLRIKKETIKALVRSFDIRGLFHILKNRHRMMEASEFMKEYEKSGYAHYLSVDEWTSLLEHTGFDIKDVRTGHYAGQGVVIVGRKR